MEAARNKLASWFSNFVSWQGATNAHSLSSVIEERRSQGAKGQTKWVSYFLPTPKRQAEKFMSYRLRICSLDQLALRKTFFSHFAKDRLRSLLLAKAEDSHLRIVLHFKEICDDSL